MEVKGVTTIFQRSEAHYGVRYTKCLSDGDSRGFSSILALNLYDTQIAKLDYVGLIQKSMGTRLLDFKSKNRGYYGVSIRNNTDHLESRKTAVWTVYFPLLSTNESPQHRLCPAGTNS
ncbi:uncharacterized protein TNCV_5006051 [Trichonephila clavipes]|nr:uncharacterized protein TNCV_5006051 [Trichonephila clavipes]